jgi:hypothetical protein
MSRRARRRLAWAAVIGGLAATLAVTGALFWNTADTRETFSGGEAQVFTAPVPHKLTKAERASIVGVAQLFLETAVARDHPERAYEIVGPMLRGGMTKKQWVTGDIPVVPYPVDSARWKVEYSNEDSVGLLVMMFPAPGAPERPVVFSMSVVPAPSGDGSRWLVAGWSPKGSGPSTIASGRRTPGEALAELAEQKRVSTQASTLWLLVPVVLLFLVFLLPLGFLVRERRIERRMRRRLTARS